MSKQIKYVNGNLYEYELYSIADRFDPSLLTKPDPFYFEDSNEHSRTPVIARNLAVSLLETMKENYGVGLAANQCGVPLRVFVMGSEGVGYAFFNPEIIETTGETSFEEGCISFPGLFLPIRRPETVKLKYQDMNGVAQEKTFSGFSARIILHEYDHMEGILFTSKVPNLILDRQKRKVPKNLKILNQQRIKDQKEAIILKAIENLALEAKKKIEPNQTLTIGA
jgi:peptide deformylase